MGSRNDEPPLVPGLTETDRAVVRPTDQGPFARLLNNCRWASRHSTGCLGARMLWGGAGVLSGAPGASTAC